MSEFPGGQASRRAGQVHNKVRSGQVGSGAGRWALGDSEGCGVRGEEKPATRRLSKFPLIFSDTATALAAWARLADSRVTWRTCEWAGKDAGAEVGREEVAAMRR